MYRNLFQTRRSGNARIPAVGRERKQLWECLDICLRDRRQAWTLDADGSWSQLNPDGDPQAPESLGVYIRF